MRKYIIPLSAIAVLLFAGCVKIDVAEDPIQVPDGEMAVRLFVEGQQAVPVRSYVDGTEDAISTIAMLCFDNEGKFITERDAEITPATSTTGKLSGTVPSNTCRVHFVANFSGLNLSSFGMGSLERSMMKSAALSSGITDHVRFWGYHKESSTESMKTWLSSGQNKVMLLRDRAQVTLIKDLAEGADAISSIQWTIANGLNKGFVAPTQVSGNDPYNNNYAESSLLTEYTSSGKYASMTDVESIWTTDGTDYPQYLFEHANSSTDPAKVIIKATYSDNSVKYHTVLLQSNDNVPYKIYRNQKFTVTVKNLPKANGKDTFSEALSTTEYSNNPYAQVDPEVDVVSDGSYTLKVEKTEYVYDSGSQGVVKFSYTAQGEGASISGLTAANFDVSWEAKSDTDETPDVVASVTTAPTVTFDSNTGAGTITFSLAEITDALKYNKLQIIAKNTGLSRSVGVYSITQFNYATDPVLVDNKTTRTVGDVDREVYKLTFKLPDDLPASQYPLKVKMYTSTLVPFSDNTATAASGSFSIVVASTSSLGETSTSSSWNYGAKSWGQYYEYTINSPSQNNEYTIYLYDIIANYSREITSVGLYFQIEKFGDPVALSVKQIIVETQTFQRANFNFRNGSASRTLGQATVALANSDDYCDHEGNHNSEYALRIGRDSGDGTITVSASSGYVISSIEITYFHRDREVGQWSGTVYWNAKDFVGGDVTSNPVTYTKSGLTGTWSGDPTQTVTLTMSRDSDNKSPRITAIKVTYQTE